MKAFTDHGQQGGVMAEEERPPADIEGAEPQVPKLPVSPDVPEVPRLAKVRPPAKPTARAQGPQPGAYRDQALAYSAVSQFVMPILVLGLLGWALQNRFHFAPWGVLVGFTLGFVVGVAALLKVINRMSGGS
jgi:F0F1-type ATP synthase assembly protein I